MVLVNRPKEMVAVEERVYVGSLAGGKGHGRLVKLVELQTDGLVEVEEY